MPTNTRRGLGWLPDIPDKHDFIYRLAPPTAPLPTKVDLRDKCPPVYDQGNLGSCTAFAIGGALEFMHAWEGHGDVHFSELFIYYQERKREHTVSSDSGAFIRDGMKVVAKYGACPEADWPYDITKYTHKPPANAVKDAKAFKTLTYMRVPQNKTAMHTILSNQEPFVIGFSVYDSFMTQQVADTGIVPMPDLTKEAVVGGHAVLAVGYNDDEGTYTVRNSWSSSWGQQGYFTISQSYFEDNSLADDLWVIQTMK